MLNIVIKCKIQLMSSFPTTSSAAAFVTETSRIQLYHDYSIYNFHTNTIHKTPRSIQYEFQETILMT